jgi:ADP-ribosylation factor GTPase-activating protein 1
MNDFFRQHNVPAKVIKGSPGTADPARVREKYYSRAAELYREKMNAVADGTPWQPPSPVPYEDKSPAEAARGAVVGGGGGGAFAMGSGSGSRGGGSIRAGSMQGMGGGGGKMAGGSFEDEAWDALSSWGSSVSSFTKKAAQDASR